MEDSVMQIGHLADGTEYQVYVPKNVTSDTKIVVYDAGSGGYDNDWIPVETALKSGECDAIVLRACYEKDMCTNRTTDALNAVISDYSNLGINHSNVVSCGHSLGGATAALRVLDVVQQDTNVGPQVMVTLDGCFEYRKLLPNELELLKQNNSILLAYYHPGYGQEYYYKQYAKSGLNVFLITDLDSGNAGDFWAQHAAANRNFFSNGLLNYVAGTSTMPTKGYECLVYNKETDMFESIDIRNINTLDKLYAYCGIDNYQTMVKHLLSLDVQNVTNLSSDSGVLNNYLNSIVRTIKNTSFLTSNIGSKSYESTTSVPSRIPSVIHEFFSTNASFLVKLSDEINQIRNIGASYDELDKNLNKNASSLSSGIVVSNETNTPNTQNKDIDNSEMIDSNAMNTINNQNEDTGISNKTENQGSQNIQPTNSYVSPSISNNGSSNYSSVSNSGGSNGTSHVESDNTSAIEEFPKYEELYSDDTKIVYNYNNEYKIIIHKDGDKIIGIEHYYNFGTEEQANKSLDMLKTKYSSDEYMDNIMQKGQYVKVVFDEKMYQSLSINDIKTKYSSLSEIIKL